MPEPKLKPPAKRADALRSARAKILEKAQRKFLFEFQELQAPSGVIADNGVMAGVNFSRTEIADGQVRIVLKLVQQRLIFNQTVIPLPWATSPGHLTC